MELSEQGKLLCSSETPRNHVVGFLAQTVVALYFKKVSYALTVNTCKQKIDMERHYYEQ